MIFGNRKRFAIECKIGSKIDSWTLGNFRFWISNESVGDYEDLTSLDGCFNWLEDFLENPRDRYESELMNLPVKEVFYLLYDSFMPEGLHYDPTKSEPFKDTFRRFYLSHLGMSSFDRFDILLLENGNQQRVLWRDTNNLIMYDATLHAGEIQQVAEEFCQWYSSERKIGFV